MPPSQVLACPRPRPSMSVLMPNHTALRTVNALRRGNWHKRPHIASQYCVSVAGTQQQKLRTNSVQAIPRVTKTRTQTNCATTTSTILSYTSTFTNPASTVTSSICNCATPTSPPLQKRAQQQATVSKPPCFSALTQASAISSACSCLSIKNGGTTTTCTTTTTTKTVKVTKKV